MWDHNVQRNANEKFIRYVLTDTPLFDFKYAVIDTFTYTRVREVHGQIILRYGTGATAMYRTGKEWFVRICLS